MSERNKQSVCPVFAPFHPLGFATVFPINEEGLVQLELSLKDQPSWTLSAVAADTAQGTTKHCHQLHPTFASFFIKTESHSSPGWPCLQPLLPERIIGMSLFLVVLEVEEG